jgi:hypothetical protein
LRSVAKTYLPPVLCALTPILCYVVVRPFAEIGIVDDWSYVKTAQVLAQTGHIVYNGWAAPMLGWQLYFGALFIKLFGFSFTAVRFATVIESMATAFLLQRVFVRAGLCSWNATLATMTFVLSPLFVFLEFTFMTDVSGVLCIVVCLYMCLRALEATSERSAMVWISLAALVNALGGTARQIAWLGVLVMVPSTLWLLRKNRRALVVGGLSCIAGACIVAASMVWFARQPYSIPEPLIPGRIDLISLRTAAGFGPHSAEQLTLLALPVLLMFVGALRSWNRRMAAVFLVGFCCFAVSGIALILTRRMNVNYSSPADDYLNIQTFEGLKPIAAHGIHPAILRNSLRLLPAGAAVLGILSLVSCSFAGAQRRPAPRKPAAAISWQKLSLMLGPFSLAYIGILVPRAMQGALFDRYLLPLLAIFLLALALYYQQMVKANLPLACVLLTAIFGTFSVAATHDVFARYRAAVSAIDQIQSTGTPATAIFGIVEFEGWTQIEMAGYVNNPRIQLPKGAWVPPPARSLPVDCDDGLPDWFPAIKPVYAIVFDPKDCVGQAAFPPVMYKTWIAPQINLIYTVKFPVPLSSAKKPSEP